jgi:pimeloyl-ACP methyl ester carboxylesterase
VNGHLLILIIHGGAFVAGTPAAMQPQADALHRLAPQAQIVNVDYPLGDPVDAYRYTRRIAVRHHGPVVAYGFSAGGYIATRLASRHEVTAAVTVAGVYHLDVWARYARFPKISWDWLGISTAAGRRRAALRPGRASAPQLMLHGDRDRTAPLGDARVYDEEDPRARLKILRGVAHDQPSGPVTGAMRWLIARGGLVPR